MQTIIIGTIFPAADAIVQQNLEGLREGEAGEANRCCGRCDGENDVCVADTVCDIHSTMGCEICFGPRSKSNEKVNKTKYMEQLLELLVLHGGKIVSTASLTPEWIEQARASGRMYVDDNSLGFVWEPDIKEFPTTVEEVEFLERWYPLPVELPAHLKDPSLLLNKIQNDERTASQRKLNQGTNSLTNNNLREAVESDAVAWISVKDKLPDYTKDPTPVLCLLSNGQMKVSYHLNNATHWMPLPALPTI
jgi:hypothetical protein